MIGGGGGGGRIITCDSPKYTMHHPDLTVSNFIGNSTGPKRVNGVLCVLSFRITSRFLLSGTLNKCFNLTKLNLSKTFVTNKGKLIYPKCAIFTLKQFIFAA